MRVDLAHWRGEIGVALALLVTAAGFAWLSLDMDVGDFAMPGPGLFPLGLAALLALTALGVLAHAWLGRMAAADRVELFPRTVVVAVGGLVLVAALFEPLGFLAAFAVFLMASFRILGGVSHGRAFAAGILVSGAAWVFFVQGLAVQLPAGLLEFF